MHDQEKLEAAIIGPGTSFDAEEYFEQVSELYRDSGLVRHNNWMASRSAKAAKEFGWAYADDVYDVLLGDDNGRDYRFDPEDEYLMRGSFRHNAGRMEALVALAAERGLIAPIEDEQRPELYLHLLAQLSLTAADELGPEENLWQKIGNPARVFRQVRPRPATASEVDHQTNIYEAAAAGQVDLSAEAARLRIFEFPNQVSRRLIGTDLAGAFVLDLGAGENTSLGEFVREHRGTHLALDIRPDALAAQPGIRLVHDLREVALPSGLADIAHARFVLAHLPTAERPRAIRQIAGTADRAILIDYDWSRCGGNPLVDAMRGMVIRLNRHRPFDPCYGATAAIETARALGVDYQITTKRFNRGPGQYYDELLLLLDGPIKADLSQPVPWAKSFAGEAAELRAAIVAEQQRATPRPFCRPDLVAITVSKAETG